MLHFIASEFKVDLTQRKMDINIFYFIALTFLFLRLVNLYLSLYTEKIHCIKTDT